MRTSWVSAIDRRRRHDLQPVTIILRSSRSPRNTLVDNEITVDVRAVHICFHRSAVKPEPRGQLALPGLGVAEQQLHAAGDDLVQHGPVAGAQVIERHTVGHRKHDSGE